MKRPNINKYPIIVNGKHQYYQDDINKYIDYLEAENKQLRIGGVSITEGELCEICNENEAKVIYKTCYACEEYIINGEHN